MKTMILGLLLTVSAFAQAAPNFTIVGKTTVSVKENYNIFEFRYAQRDEKVTAYVTEKGDLILLENEQRNNYDSPSHELTLRIFEQQRSANGDVILGKQLFEQRVVLSHESLSQMDSTQNSNCRVEASISNSYVVTQTNCTL